MGNQSLCLKIHGTIRQIEQIIPNFPSYGWYDPLLNYPFGKDIFWGPVFPIFGALVSILLNASTQYEIIRVVSWIPPLVLIPMAPICFYIGKTLWNSNAGYLCVILMCFISGEFFYRTQYGYVDHHCFEVLFFLGLLLYIYS